MSNKATRINNATDTGILDNELDVLEALSADKGFRNLPVRFFVASGDDIYAVLASNEEHGRYLAVQMVYAGDVHNHEISQAAVFDNQFKATVHICKIAAEEEFGYGREAFEPFSNEVIEAINKIPSFK